MRTALSFHRLHGRRVAALKSYTAIAMSPASFACLDDAASDQERTWLAQVLGLEVES